MPVTRYTLDPDFLISAATSPRDAEWLGALGQCHADGKADIAVVALAPIDERGNVLATFDESLRRFGLTALRQIVPMCDNEPDVLDRCAERTDAAVRQQLDIHNVLFPNRAFELDEARRRHGVVDAENPKFRRKWLEARRNVQCAWAHIRNGGEVLVTDNQNFFKRTKRPGLERLGIRRIERLETVAEAIAGLR
jgi:hypothetical protein